MSIYTGTAAGVLPCAFQLHSAPAAPSAQHFSLAGAAVHGAGDSVESTRTTIYVQYLSVVSVVCMVIMSFISTVEEKHIVRDSNSCGGGSNNSRNKQQQQQYDARPGPASCSSSYRAPYLTYLKLRQGIEVVPRLVPQPGYLVDGYTNPGKCWRDVPIVPKLG